MPHGARKWSNIGADKVVFGLTDMAEAVARLGSVDTHNREGNVIFIETFAHGLGPWEVGAWGSGAEVIISAQKYRSNGFSCKLVAGSDGSRAAQIARAFPYPTLGNYSFEFSVNLDDNCQYLIWTLAHRDGAHEHQYQCMYMPADKKIVVTIAGGSSVDAMTDVDLYTSYGLFHTIKIVADFGHERYLRLIVNDREVDLSANDEYVFANSAYPHVMVALTLYGNVASNATAFVDDVILKQNEPS